MLGLCLVILLTVEAIYLWPTLSESWRALTEIHWGWVALCIAAQAVSLSGFGAVQQRLLRAGNVVVSQIKSVSVIYASTAMSVSLPAGQVFSTAFTYKQTRKWGATPVVASWQLAISGVIAAGSLALIGVAGAFAVGTRVSPVTLVLSLVAAAVLFYLLRHVVKNPDSIETVGRWTLARFNRLRKKPLDTGLNRWKEILEQLDSVELKRADMLATFAWSGVHRGFDVVCLGLSCWAIGAEPSLAGLLIAFAAAKAVGSIPLAPGGLGFVDGTLIATLTAAGATASQALAAVFVYRVVSYIMVALVGWVTFLVLFRNNHHEDTELERDFGLRRGTPTEIKSMTFESRTSPEPEPER